MELSVETPIYLANAVSPLVAKYSCKLCHDPHSNLYNTHYEPRFAYGQIETGESSKVIQLVSGTVELKFLSVSLFDSQIHSCVTVFTRT